LLPIVTLSERLPEERKAANIPALGSIHTRTHKNATEKYGESDGFFHKKSIKKYKNRLET
jgi:hypothetical protein